jgi:23S rRNA pseudouridine2605 synthase
MTNPTDHSKNPKLHAFLAHAGIASRRKAEEMIQEGRVQVNGTTGVIGQRVNPEKDKIVVDGKAISQAEKTVMYLINKPPGVISTTSDELGRQTVIDFLQKEMSKEKINQKLPRLYPVGRLDQDSEGLMILTNNGELAQKMTHPSFETKKTYKVTVDGFPTEKALSHLERGVLLKEGMTAPAEVEVLHSGNGTTTLTITIHEGRYHQVKRMFLRVGYEVTRLVRIQMGPYSLEDLEGKKWREVSPETFASANDSTALD